MAKPLSNTVLVAIIGYPRRKVFTTIYLTSCTDLNLKPSSHAEHAGTLETELKQLL